MKTKTLHRHLHPIHWHGSMYVAIVAILLTASKSSGELLRQLQQAPVETGVMSSIFLRDAENIHMPVLLSAGLRNATLSGQ
jgi:hypothetical protein